MSEVKWSTVLQVSRLGANGGIFLVLAFFLNAKEIGIYLAIFSVYQIMTALTRHGFSNVVVRHATMTSGDFGAINLTTVVSNLLLSPLFGIPIMKADNGAPLETFILLAVVFALVAQVDCLTTLPEAILRRNLDFRRLAYRSLFSLAISSLVASIAFLFDPLLSLSVFSLLNSILNFVVSCFAANYIPTFKLPEKHNYPYIREGFAYNVANFMQGATQPIFQLVVTTGFGIEVAGIYGLVGRIMTVSGSVFFEPIRQIGIPILARIQSISERQAKFIELSRMIIFRSVITFSSCGVLSYFIVLYQGRVDERVIFIICSTLYAQSIQAVYSFNFQMLGACGRHSATLFISMVQLGISVLGASMTIWSGSILFFLIFDALKYVPGILMQNREFVKWGDISIGRYCKYMVSPALVGLSTLVTSSISVFFFQRLELVDQVEIAILVLLTNGLLFLKFWGGR